MRRPTPPSSAMKIGAGISWYPLWWRQRRRALLPWRNRRTPPFRKASTPTTSSMQNSSVPSRLTRRLRQRRTATAPLPLKRAKTTLPLNRFPVRSSARWWWSPTLLTSLHLRPSPTNSSYTSTGSPRTPISTLPFASSAASTPRMVSPPSRSSRTVPTTKACLWMWRSSPSPAFASGPASSRPPTPPSSAAPSWKPFFAPFSTPLPLVLPLAAGLTYSRWALKKQ